MQLPLASRRRAGLGVYLLVVWAVGLAGPCQLAAPLQAQEKPTAQDARLGLSEDGVLRFDPRTLPAEVSLVECVRDCLVSLVEGDVHGPIFSVSGQVTRSDGSAAAQATVILRESPQKRVSSQPHLLELEDRHLLAVPDVFAKTLTDENGRYSFDKIKSPGLPDDRFRESWDWNVVCVADKELIGFLQLDSARTPQKNIQNANVVLQPTATIEGTLLSDVGVPLSQGIVGLTTLRSSYYPGRGYFADGMASRDLVAWMSSFSPWLRTGNDGRFRIAGVPTGCVAVLQAHHADFVGGGAAVATSDDVPLGKNSDPLLARLSRFDVVASPVQLVMEVGKFIQGSVTAGGRPVVGAKVNFSSHPNGSVTDAAGEFRFRYSELQARDGQPARLAIQPAEGSDLLSRLVVVHAEQLDAQQPLPVELVKGVRVQGRVLCQGKPLANISIRAAGAPDDSYYIRGANTRADGTFECLLPPRPNLLFLCTDIPGYKLPTISEALLGRGGSVPENWPQRELELSEADAGREPVQLAPFQVETSGMIEIQALLPDGSPAENAIARLKDQIERGQFMDDIEISEAFVLDETGSARVALRGSPTPAAYAMVQLTNELGAYSGKAPLSKQSAEGKLTVALSKNYTVRGRVMLNSKPVTGARISIARAELWNRQGSFRSIHLAFAVTDADGQYTAEVEPAERYSIRVEALLGRNELISRGHVGFQTAAGLVEVAEFNFQTGDEEIHGQVVDSNRKPLVGVRVQVQAAGDNRSHILIGYADRSQLETDTNGEFHLRGLAQGTYEISAYAPRNLANAGNASSIKSVRVEAATGDMNVKMFMARTSEVVTPRLPVRSISDF